MTRHLINYVPWNDRKIVAKDLKQIYHAQTAELAALQLDEFEEK